MGSLVVGQLWPLILERASLEPHQRHITSVYIDEVQDYLALPGDLSDALAQARSLGVAFHLAHQFRTQLPARLKAAIDANARNKIIFGLSASDASDIAKQAPGLEPHDFQLLPRFSTYVRAMYQGQEQPWTLAKTMPLPPVIGNAAELRAASSQRYGQDAHVVEAMLLQRLGLHPALDASPSAIASAATVIGRRPKSGGSR